MRIIADTHTHTVASTHAYSTILENARFASENGILYLGMTDHAPKICDAPHLWHFRNLAAIPETLFGVRILKGAEVNILENGEVDLDEETLNMLEWVVASYHAPACPPSSFEEHTKAYINVAKNPHVTVIGHSGSPAYSYDYEKAVKAFREYDKAVEINSHTFEARKQSVKNCLEIARLCKKYEAKIVVNSDAHFAYDVGRVDLALQALEEIGFPEKLVINSSKELFEEFLKSKKIKGI